MIFVLRVLDALQAGHALCGIFARAFPFFVEVARAEADLLVPIFGAGVVRGALKVASRCWFIFLVCVDRHDAGELFVLNILQRVAELLALALAMVRDLVDIFLCVREHGRTQDGVVVLAVLV